MNSRRMWPRCILSSTIFAFGALAWTSTPAGAASPEKETVRYLFIDDRHVEQATNLQRVFHQPTKEKKPVLLPDRPWEQTRLLLWSAPVWLPDQGIWRMWYNGGEGLLPLCADSADGLHWTKPSLGLVSWQDSKDNNVIRLGFPAAVPKENRLVVLRDPYDPDPHRRFKALTRVRGRLTALVSADGLDWKPAPSKFLASHDEYRLGYDEIQRRFIVTVKTVPASEQEHGMRSVSLSVSRDFVNWTPPKLVFWGDAQDQRLGRRRIETLLQASDRQKPIFVRPSEFTTDIYNAPVFTYAGRYLGLPLAFNQSGKVPPLADRGSQDGILYPTLAVSDDLEHWDRLQREPLIPLSPLSHEECWDHGLIHATAPVRHGDELWFYYTGTRFTHVPLPILQDRGLVASPDEPQRAIFLARLRRDGFASLQAGDASGSIVTKPLEVAGSQLYLNVDGAPENIRVELRDARTGAVFPGFQGEASRMRLPDGAKSTNILRRVKWDSASDLNPLRGRTIRIAVTLRQAALYSLWFAD